MNRASPDCLYYFTKEGAFGTVGYSSLTYKWLNTTPSKHQIEDEQILEQIEEIAESNNSLFGAMNMYYKLRDKYQFTCGHNRVYRIMCINDKIGRAHV